MKNTMKRILAVTICVVMTLTAAPLGGFAGLNLSDLFSIKADALGSIPYCPYGEEYWDNFGVYHNPCAQVSVAHCHFGISGGGVQVTSCVNRGGAASTVAIPSSYHGYPVTSIGKYAFSPQRCGNINLISVIIPSTVRTIESSAFYESSLTNITIPDSVTSIGESAFYGCEFLESVTIGNGLSTIGTNTFARCSKLNSVTIGNSVTTIGEGAFWGCSSLTDLEFIPENVKIIGEIAFQYCHGFTDIKIPEGVKELSMSSFSSCSNLESISFPESLETIGEHAFRECNKLKNVTISEGVTTIGSYAFHSCDSLEKVTIPQNVSNIGEAAFSCCYALELILVDENNEYYSDDGGVLFTKDQTRLMQYPIGSKRANYTVPDDVTTIDTYSFYGCENLEYIHLPESIESIGEIALKKQAIHTSVQPWKTVM